METNIIITIIVVVLIVVVTIIMRWAQRQKLYKFIDDVFELLINPSIQSLGLHNGKVNIKIIKKEIEFCESADYYLTRLYRLKIIKEAEIGITGITKLTVCLINKKDISIYDKHIEISKWK